MVNEGVESLKIEEKQPFEGFREALERAAGQADIAVVSSANPETVFTECGCYRLLDHVDAVCAGQRQQRILYRAIKKQGVRIHTYPCLR